MRADGRDAQDHRFTQVPLDVVLLGVAEPAVRQDRGLTGLDRCLGPEVLGRIGLAAAGFARPS